MYQAEAWFSVISLNFPSRKPRGPGTVITRGRYTPKQRRRRRHSRIPPTVLPAIVPPIHERLHGHQLALGEKGLQTAIKPSYNLEHRQHFRKYEILEVSLPYEKAKRFRHWWDRMAGMT